MQVQKRRFERPLRRRLVVPHKMKGWAQRARAVQLANFFPNGKILELPDGSWLAVFIGKDGKWWSAGKNYTYCCYGDSPPDGATPAPPYHWRSAEL